MTGLKIANENNYGIYLLLAAHQAGVGMLQLVNSHYPSKKL